MTLNKIKIVKKWSLGVALGGRVTEAWEGCDGPVAAYNHASQVVYASPLEP